MARYLAVILNLNFNSHHLFNNIFLRKHNVLATSMAMLHFLLKYILEV